ncbi:MAG: bifunctional 23S rRNA (guanine(2069)-N(7))-methyltransferase RlmK/23S rRNA (guanine(2445)-N(2))-methyltransferase RlmL, partial [Coriobacteriia bacterium]|nr:bifunctional 23S rRNA (guanine(2069)-N(7))-methyltransferase RlmK/23S rRNA (guanine(2445)-N(2))-methyltransferase RlmL [Coriobacteriia bacterium]
MADELRALRCQRIRPLGGGVSFAGPLETAYRALLWSRVASRVLLTIARVSAATADALYAAVREIPWEDHLRADGTMAIDANGVNPELRNTQFTAVRVKDAIADRFVAQSGIRPSVDTNDPDVRINVVIHADKATISIDIAGSSLHRRGYREQGIQVEAPMKETLAAAILLLAEWPAIAKAGGALVDPLCGSGTLCIEGALIAGDVAPGITRARWGFERWLGHDEAAWQHVIAEADRRAEAGLAQMPPIEGYDYDPRAVDVARACVRRAGLAGKVLIERRELAELVPPAAYIAAAPVPGLVVANPPYGERIQARAGLPALYAELAERLRAGFDGWTLAVITPDAGLSAGVQMTPRRVVPLYNGKIESLVSIFTVGEVEAEAGSATGAGRGAATAIATGAPLTESQAAFSNRLRKVAKHTEKWARRTGVTCYRVYDADLPDYSVAIDVYDGSGANDGTRWVHVAEYAPPSGIDPDKAEQRLLDVLAVVPGVLGVEAQDVFLKTRERQRGTSQYERFSRKGVVGTVLEGGMTFEVNLSDYLDTGLFLDHRITRQWLRELAPGKRFLNLFAYTGTASVYAAAGGAASTTTVDMSTTYVEWSGRNLSRNGFSGPKHQLIRADVLGWVSAAQRGRERYDLIFCDPPTFSNSKRMSETWDVQRDHAALIV